MKNLSWLFFRIRIPDDWEMSRYGLKPESGQCVFSDALAERMRLSWRRVAPLSDEAARARDLRRRLQDVRRYMERRERDVRFEEIQPVAGPWLGLRIAGATPSWIAARYLHAEDDEFLLEAEVDAARDDGRTALRALSTLTARDPGVWYAYHLHLRIHPPWMPYAARIYPGSSELEFRQGEEIFQVFSINPATTDLTIENMIGRLMHSKERIVSRREDRLGPHSCMVVETRRLAARGFIARLKRVHDLYVYAGWLCDNRTQPRIFLVRYRRQRPTGVLPEGVEVRCCSG